MDYPPVLTKRDFTRRYLTGEFGNASPSWLTLEEFRAQADPDGVYHMRNGAAAGGVTYYKQTNEQVIERWSNELDQSAWYCSEQVPQTVVDGLLLQGEVMQSEQGLYLYYSTVAKPMRDALKQCATSVYRLASISLLRMYLCPNSIEWMWELLRRYPDHVVEFSAFRQCWGTLFPIYNTVFWEVRGGY